MVYNDCTKQRICTKAIAHRQLPTLLMTRGFPRASFTSESKIYELCSGYDIIDNHSASSLRSSCNIIFYHIHAQSNEWRFVLRFVSSVTRVPGPLALESRVVRNAASHLSSGKSIDSCMFTVLIIIEIVHCACVRLFTNVGRI